MKKLFNLSITIENPIVKNHIVHGQSMLPGLAYIDMIYRMAQQELDIDFKKICLKQLSIYNPLIVTKDQPVEITVSFEQKSTYWGITIEDCHIDEHSDTHHNWLYATAELHEESISLQEQINIQDIKLSARKSIDIETVYAKARQRGLIHQGVIKAKADIYLIDSGCLVELSVDDEHHDNAVNNTFFHPTLIDGAAMASSVLNNNLHDNNGDLFIPLYYELFYSKELLQSCCYALVDSSSVRVVNDIRSLDIHFYNRTGNLIAKLAGITIKQIRFKEQINKDIKYEPTKILHPNVEDILRKIVSKYLREEASQINLDTVFFELGLESAQLLLIVKDIENALSLSLNPTLLFENSNLRELLITIEKKLQKEREYSHLVTDKELNENPTNHKFSLDSKTYEFYEDEAYLQDHLVFGKSALMGVTHPCLVLETFLRNNPGSVPVELKDIQFLGGPVTLEKNEKVHVKVLFHEENGVIGFKTEHYISNTDVVKACCQGRYINSIKLPHKVIDIDAMINQSKEIDKLTINKWYHIVKNFSIGPMLRNVEEAFQYDENTLITKVQLSNKLKKGDISRFVFDPLLLNACYMTLNVDDDTQKDNIFIPLMIESLTVFRQMAETAYVINNIRSKRDNFISFDAVVLSDKGEVIAELSNASVKEVLKPSLLYNASFDMGHQDNKANVIDVVLNNESVTTEALDIAVIGIAGRFPQSYDVNEFWQNLKEGKDCISEIPQDRWDWREYFTEERAKPGYIYSKWGGFIEDMDKFDPGFFNISPREAESLDPQERLFLQHSWMAMEDAGYTREKLQKIEGRYLPGQVGVYAGVMYQEYPLLAAESCLKGQRIGLPGGISSIATRVSYFCNFHGPSMAIDTMCSGSLTSIYLACQALKNKHIDAALAGGVNLTIHPNKYLMLSQGQFISSKGHCESFGIGGDGYIPGEGVGVLFLKRLSDAKRDKDHIYGVIKGMAINHGGKASGYTVPNPKAQSMVISHALNEAGIDPRTVSFIEAHGTGTKLGDPIEIAALTEAFEKQTNEKQYCRIGSVKSNIGHCESAAGVAGVIKVLLQMKYRQIVPSLHSRVLNPNIDFAVTPFIVNQELHDWERPVVGGKVQPLRAGVSSFGAGGLNAHIVIEEYKSEKLKRSYITVNTQKPAIIVLSARTREQLTQQVKHLLEALIAQKLCEDDLADIAYTLQVGREAMEERMAFIVLSIKELEEKLKEFLEGKTDISNLYLGQVKRNNDSVTMFTTDEDLKEAVSKWIKKSKYEKLLNLWVKGLSINWDELYGEAKPCRISLPTYPFARERYWVPQVNGMLSGAIGSTIHPLVQKNTSDFSGQRFTSIFSGKEFFFSDHVVRGKKVLPGVAYLEMVRVAAEQAAGFLKEGHLQVNLKNVVWVQPVTADGPSTEVHIGLSLQENREINYQIYSQAIGADPIIHGQGIVTVNSVTDQQTLDLRELQSECNLRSINSSQCYEAFKQLGIEYGPGHRAIKELYIGTNKVLAKLRLPASVSDTLEHYVLHPGMLDAAFQASIGLIDDITDEKRKQVLPFALQQLEVLGRCSSKMWAFIRPGDINQLKTGIQNLDIDLCNEKGTVCVRMKGLSSRVFEEGLHSGISAKKPVNGNNMLTPVWDRIGVQKDHEFPNHKDNIVLLGGANDREFDIKQQYPNAQVLEIESTDTIEEITNKLQTSGSIDHIIWIAPYHSLNSLGSDEVISLQNQGVYYCFRMIKALIGLGYGTRELGWSVITTQSQLVHKNDLVNPIHASIHGLIGSMANEYSNWKVRLIDIEQGSDWVKADIFRLPVDTHGDTLAYRKDSWYRQKLVPLNYCSSLNQKLYKKNGVYVVIGGAGGIGQVWSEYMIRNYQARIIWIGRRQKDVAIQLKIDELSKLDPAPIYISADATNYDSLQKAYTQIKQQYSHIDGVIHSAIVLSDQSLANMEEDKFKAGLTAKVDVSVRIAQVFKMESLDFILFFSSINSFTRNSGQSNYVSGCTFEDAFAQRLSLEWKCAVKVMNWGYWGSVGIVSSEAYQERMRTAGIGSIEPAEAMDALEQLLEGPVNQVAFIKTTKSISIEETKSEELISIYNTDIPSRIQNMQCHMPVQDKLVEKIKLEMGIC